MCVIFSKYSDIVTNAEEKNQKSCCDIFIKLTLGISDEN